MIPIVLSTDHNYVMPTGVTISSLLRCAEGQSCDIYIMAGADVDGYDRRMLERQVNEISPLSRISFIDMSTYFHNAHEIRGITKATYYRLMIPWLLPHLDKVIYSDVDVIYRVSPGAIFDIDLSGCYIAGAMARSSEYWGKYRKYFDKIGVDYTHYINAGILVMNSRLLREDDLNKKFDILATKKFHFQDQDILNIACRGRIAFLDRRYNLFPSLYGTEERYSKEVIIHYAGDKPWNSFTYAWAEWWDAYERSIFKDGMYYHKVCRSILNPRHQIKAYSTKVKVHLQLLKRRFL